MTDRRLWIPTVELYTYPDVMIVAEPPELKPGRDTVINPIFIAKTLSRSTQNDDRGDKLVHYRTIASLIELTKQLLIRF